MKILVIRFSSMGDIIYTTPVVRCLKKQLPSAEVHFFNQTLPFKYIYDNNPYVDKLLLLKDELADTITEIKAETIRLYHRSSHNNLRTALIKLNVQVKSSTYKKQRIQKWLSLKFKLKLVPPEHLVDRYLKTVAFLGVKNDEQPIDYYIKADHKLSKLLPPSYRDGYVAFIIGATHFTKRMPNSKIISICNQLKYPVVLLGGNDVKANGDEIAWLKLILFTTLLRYKLTL